MPGRMGYDNVTVKNLRIIKVDKENYDGIDFNQKANEFLKTHPEFMIDTDFEKKLIFTCAKGGWLKRI
jgi:cephalosporin hydroxylase